MRSRSYSRSCAAQDHFLAQRDVVSRRRADQQSEAHGVGAVFIIDDERIDHVPLGFRHLLALGVAHQTVNMDLPERLRFAPVSSMPNMIMRAAQKKIMSKPVTSSDVG